MAAQKKTINLLPKDTFEKGFLGKFLKWGLTFGRHIIVFTELIVIIVFISRFKLDRDLAELNQEISRKQTIIVASTELETEARFLQKRLAVIKSIYLNSLNATLIIDELTRIIPIDVYFSKLEIGRNSISLTGISLSNAGLATFLGGLKDSELFENLDLNSVSSGGEEDPSLQFEIQASRVLHPKEEK
ncbi:MAG TPA: PilN domain-containing protein [Candidatus Bathyarchaeia archaeon]|nr:PilN domain-containing protein [Candidatus Bathyarchaeia archaeon]